MLQTKPDLQRFLDRLTSRSVLTEQEQQAILDLPTHTVQARAHQDFVRLGERVDHSSFIVDGLVGRFDQNSNGARQITALHLPGDMPDLQSVVQSTATSALQALTTTTILKVPHVEIRAVAGKYPAIAEALWRDCTVDAMILAQWVVNVGRREAKARIAHLLCEIACRSRANLSASKVVFELPMTQAHLADATGLTSVHVNRTLKTLKQIGVEVSSGIVSTADWKGLVEVGDFNPDYLQASSPPQRRLCG